MKITVAKANENEVSNRQIPTEHKTQTSQENNKYNDSKPFISSHFTKLFLCAWIQGWIYSCPRKSFPNTASYKSTTSYLRYLQPQHQTATKYDTMVVAVKKNNATVKTDNFKQLAKQGIVRCKCLSLEGQRLVTERKQVTTVTNDHRSKSPG